MRAAAASPWALGLWHPAGRQAGTHAGNGAEVQSRAPRLQLTRRQRTAYPIQYTHACMHAKMRACSFLRASLAVASNQAGASLELKGRSARARDNRWDSSTATPRAELEGASSSWQGGRSAQQRRIEAGQNAEQQTSG